MATSEGKRARARKSKYPAAASDKEEHRDGDRRKQCDLLRQEGEAEQEPREHEKRIGKAIRRKLGELPEDRAEDDHRYQRLEENPADTESSLLVAHSDLSPDQEEKQLPVLPQLARIEGERAPAGLDHKRFPAGDITRARCQAIPSR